MLLYIVGFYGFMNLLAGRFILRLLTSDQFLSGFDICMTTFSDKPSPTARSLSVSMFPLFKRCVKFRCNSAFILIRDTKLFEI